MTGFVLRQKKEKRKKSVRISTVNQQNIFEKNVKTTSLQSVK